MGLGLGLTRQLVANDAAHGEHYNAVTREQAFMASMQAGAALGTALTATAVTLTLYNPATSGVRVILLDVQVGITTVPGVGSTAFVLAVNNDLTAAVPAVVTETTIRSCLLGGTKTSKIKAYTAATLPAVPAIGRVISSTYFATAAAAAQFDIKDKIGGAICLQPNTCVTVQGVGIASSGIVSLMWEEVPYAL